MGADNLSDRLLVASVFAQGVFAQQSIKQNCGCRSYAQMVESFGAGRVNRGKTPCGSIMNVLMKTPAGTKNDKHWWARFAEYSRRLMVGKAP